MEEKSPISPAAQFMADEANPRGKAPPAPVTRPIMMAPIIMGEVIMPSPETQTTVGAAGGASALPATPTGYLKIVLGDTEFVLPYYAQS